MGWAMSNDYAAVVTTINAAVLLVGTVQYTGLTKRVGDRIFAATREQAEVKALLLDQRRQGTDPSPESLVRLREQRDELRRRTRANVVASLIWSVTCASLLVQQMRILAWTGTAHPGPASGLARSSFYVTVTGVLVLVAEPLARGCYRLWRGVRRGSLEYRQRYPRPERRRLARQVRGATRPTVHHATSPAAAPPAPTPGAPRPRRASPRADD
ncbi:hypothetical protein ACLGI4_00455 [Streptomyces sp. HMX112]|uniref:hypothetical protein n=1 Tax=Streptomyces sp. HMX112 TaxID=3390850 RepID=UPI003A80FBDA